MKKPRSKHIKKATRAEGRSRRVEVARESGYLLSNSAVERALLTGEHADLLTNLFGESAYDELTQLARSTAVRVDRAGWPAVLILPGIMGTKLGYPVGGL